MRWWLLGAATALAVVGGCTGTIGDPIGNGAPGGSTNNPDQFAPGEPTIYRLTSAQLKNAYTALLGEPLDITAQLPADDQLYGFTSISAGSQTISPLDAERYETAAYQMIDQVWADPARREALVGCALTAVTEPCVRSFLDDFGLHAFRRPLQAAEVDALVKLGDAIANDLKDPWLGLRFALGAVLQSPHFLFRVEAGVDDPATGLLRYTSWEMASRLSFLITDAPPDDELLTAAAAGELEDVEQVRFHAARLLDSPRARPALIGFFRDFMNISRLDQMDKSAEVFPMLTATLGPSMRAEIERLFESTVFEREADFRELFTTRETFVNEELARVYGIEGVTGPDLVPVTLPDDGRRAGLLTTPGFLAMNAHKTATSPTHRGRFVRINLLCQDVPPPPQGVNTTLPEPEAGAPPQTLRQRLEKHRQDASCSGCHDRMDPIGFALENFDALGVHRETDNGMPVDTSTSLDGEPIANGVELGALVGSLPTVGECIARRFYQHASGHLDKRSEKIAVTKLVDSFVQSDFNFKELVMEMVVSDGYRYASVPSEVKGK